jgi:hypothetical protein
MRVLQRDGLAAVQDDPREAEACSNADDRLGSVERQARRYSLLDIIIMDARPKNTMPPISMAVLLEGMCGSLLSWRHHYHRERHRYRATYGL